MTIISTTCGQEFLRRNEVVMKDRGASRSTLVGSQKVRHDLVTEQ